MKQNRDNSKYKIIINVPHLIMLLKISNQSLISRMCKLSNIMCGIMASRWSYDLNRNIGLDDRVEEMKGHWAQ